MNDRIYITICSLIGVGLLITLALFSANTHIATQDHCGDGICDYKIGENAYTCPEDCYVHNLSFLGKSNICGICLRMNDKV